MSPATFGLDASDVQANLAAHIAAPDPHPQYVLDTDLLDALGTLPWLNVADEQWGLALDGTDDRADLQSVIDAATALGKGVMIPSGLTVGIAGNLSLTCDLYMTGATLKKTAAFSTGYAVTIPATNPDVRWFGGTLDGHRAGGALGNGVSNLTAAKMFNVKVKGVKGIAYVTSTTAGWLTCYDCVAEDCITGDGVAIGGGAGFWATSGGVIKLYRCLADEVDLHGVYCVGRSSAKLTVTVKATAGDWVYSNVLGSTGNLSATISAAALQTALEALPGIGAGNVLVSGGPGNATGSTPYVIDFRVALAYVAIPTGSAAAAGTTPLSGGSGAGANTVSLTINRPGNTGAGDYCHVDGTFRRCRHTGAVLHSSRGTGGRIVTDYCNQYGAVIGQDALSTGTHDWDIQQNLNFFPGSAFTSSKGANVAADPSGCGLELFGAHNNRIAMLQVVGPSGYGLAMTRNSWTYGGASFSEGSKNNQVGVFMYERSGVIDSDPGYHLSGDSTENVVGVYECNGASFAWSIGEGVAGNPNHNLIGTLIANSCPFGIWSNSTGSHNTIDRVIARDCYTAPYDPSGVLGGSAVVTVPAIPALVYHGGGVTGNRINSYEHKTNDAPIPYADFAQAAGTTGNTAKTPGGVGPPATQTADYTLVRNDEGRSIEMNAAGTTVVTLPPYSSVRLPVGSIVEVCRLGAGAVNIAAGAGVTIRSRGSLLGIANQYSSVSARKRDTDEWVLVGDLA